MIKEFYESSVGPLFDYLKKVSIFKMIIQGIFILTIIWGIAAAYILATNFEIFKSYFGIHSPREFERGLVETASSSIKIQKILETIIEETGAARAYIVVFHNGKISANGKSFYFQSMIEEVVRPGVSSRKELSRDIPVTSDPEQLQAFVEDNCYSTSINTQNFPELGKFIHETGVAKVYQCPIHNVDNYLIGYIGVDFNQGENIKGLDIANIFRALQNLGDAIRLLI